MLKQQQQTEKTSKKIKYSCRNKITKTKIILDSDSEKELDNDQENDNIDNDEIEIDLDNLITNEKLSQYNSQIISKYIVKDKIYDFNSKSIICYYLWSGVEDLDRWELNRKINTSHVKKIYKDMVMDYDKKGEFIFYEPIHLALKYII